MSLYRLARPLLFSLDEENAHQLALYAAGVAGLFSAPVPRSPVRAMGIEFPNPIGLAAGLDKDAAHIDALAALGFGFVEVGTVTPRAQPGNARPRLFRLPERDAIINRFGFNNVGVDAFIANVRRARWNGVLGINIGKNADTPPERAIDDYELCLKQVYPHASYVTINVSSPNTQGLRTLQEAHHLEALVKRLTALREPLAERYGRRVPLVVKVAPDLNTDEIGAIADAVRRYGIEGVIATNTSLSREGVEGLRHAGEAGGLSGAPIREMATRVLREFAFALKGETTLIGAGGVMSGADAQEKFAAGAQLVQLYTGLIYRGPDLVSECASAFRGK
ncbi:MAG: quinone-dependent dihydroorotate dehydrogenase [Betaproteobacteria bacterium]|nr:MAG: quinone-dependent dihydroorotate dehydrogenase [Betaproteobacteria bacterium]